MNQPFRYLLRVRYSECDAQKIVFNARYGEYVDLATTEFFKHLGFAEELGNGELEYQLVKQTTEWKSSARFDQVLELSVIPKQVGNTSFTMLVEFRLAGEQRLNATTETVYVRVDPGLMSKTPLSDGQRQALSQYSGGGVVDHAGYHQR